MINYYKTLKIPRTATAEEIKEAYRRKAMKYHPDVSDSPRAHGKFQEINEAYSTLIDPLRKQKYDLLLEYGLEGIAAAIKKEKEPKHKDPAYKPKSEDFIADYMRRKSRSVVKDKRTKRIENVAFSVMLFIGLTFLCFACLDIVSEDMVKRLPGVAGLVASIAYLILLLIGWRLVLGRKFR